MNTVRQQQGIYTIKTDDTIESIGLDKPKATFRKIFVYPGAPDAASTTTGLAQNANPVYLGLDCDGLKLTPDVLNATDEPREYAPPETKDGNEQMLLKDLLVRGKAGDSVYFVYWS